MNSDQLFKTLVHTLSDHADAKLAPAMAAYMKNKFPFLGIKKPLRALITKPFVAETKNWPIDEIHNLVKLLWEQPEREFQYIAMQCFESAKKRWNKDSLILMEYMIVNKSWWDTVDTVAANLAGPCLLQAGDAMRIKTALKWNQSDNMWLNRAAIIHQLKYKDQTDEQLLFEVIRNHADSNEFFIRKAIGWALRQYARTAPEVVANFVATNTLKPLSVREALKHL